jgi:hypothetical protein
VLARSIEPDAILYGALDRERYTSLVWLGREDKAPEPVVAALQRWRPVLSTRAEIARNPRRRWWESAWPRDKRQLRAPEVIALHRTDRGRFALDEAGEWQPSIKTTICTAKQEPLSVAYLCGLLNSELLDLWYAVRGKHPRDVWRNYEPKPMARIPYRHVERIAEAAETERLKALGEALRSGDVAAARALLAALGDELASGGETVPEAAAALEALVRSIAANREALLPLRELVPALGRIVKDPWRTGPVELDVRAAVAALPAEEVISVRLDPALRLDIATDGPIGKPRLEEGRLVFTRGRHIAAAIEGPAERLELLERVVAGRSQLMPDDLAGTLLPRDRAAFDAWTAEQVATVGGLLEAGRVMVELAERLVCRLYGLPAELEAAVVDHAVRRAAETGGVRAAS